MKERILEFLKKENKSSSQFAEEIGVQPSGISHILSGRNNPSLDFVLKMLEKYNYLSTEWLLFGKGEMYKEIYEPTLFNGLENGTFESPVDAEVKSVKKSVSDGIPSGNDNKEAANRISYEPDVIKIVWFYSDGSFNEYHKRKD